MLTGHRAALTVVLLVSLLAGCASNNTPTPSVNGTTPTGSTGGSNPAPVACDPPATAPDPAWKAETPRVLLSTTKGDITLDLAMEQAPLTAGNFYNLTASHFYDNVTFHRVAKNFVIQGGDPTGTGGGGPGYEIKDEFNPQLRHSAAGILSMATAGPDTGGSQFFITLVAAASLDDRHSVFGKVESGMEVVNAIGALAPASGDGAPTEKVTIKHASTLDATPYDAKHGVGLHTVITEKKATGGRPVTFAVILQNTGNVRDSIGLQATVPAGWSCKVDQRPVVPAGTGRVVFVTITPDASATGSTEIPLRAVSAWDGTPEASGSVKVTIANLGADVKDGTKVTANYVGMLPDGRLFDTSVKAVGDDATMPKMTTVWRAHPSYSTFGFTVGTGVIGGFTNLAKTAKEGETVTSLIPAKDAYATGSMYQNALVGRELVFELEIVKIG